MREIKFKAWAKESKIFLNDDFNLIFDTQGLVAINSESGISVNLDFIELSQFTGLLDKNGKEIYEGDIVRLHRFIQVLGENMGVMEGEEEIDCEVTFSYWGVGFKSIKIPSDFMLYSDYEANNDIEEQVEIIGNIYENPELLNEAKK